MASSECDALAESRDESSSTVIVSTAESQSESSAEAEATDVAAKTEAHDETHENQSSSTSKHESSLSPPENVSEMVASNSGSGSAPISMVLYDNATAWVIEEDKVSAATKDFFATIAASHSNEPTQSISSLNVIRKSRDSSTSPVVDEFEASSCQGGAASDLSTETFQNHVFFCLACKRSFNGGENLLSHADAAHSAELVPESKRFREFAESGQLGCLAITSVDSTSQILALRYKKTSNLPQHAVVESLEAPLNAEASKTETSLPQPIKIEHRAGSSAKSSVVSCQTPPSAATPSTLPKSSVDPILKAAVLNPDSNSRSAIAPPKKAHFSMTSLLSAGKCASTAVTTAASVTEPLPKTPPVAAGTTTQCNLHPDGKAQGVECPKCDTVLGSSRSLGGHITMMHSRNSCKTLKCPKCNWHYKYQETLEIHMKEKHPESEVTCVYCLANQQHPRLARGETYGCGYKPYRCDICKYSTTTKGNLSIHMQSDKHLNNVQELQQGKLIADPTALIQSQARPPTPEPLAAPLPLPPPAPKPVAPATTSSSSRDHRLPSSNSSATSSTSSPSKPPAPPAASKPSWHCEVCNYETNVARNLRIHMTSEKHTHNMLLLQQHGFSGAGSNAADAATALAAYSNVAQTLANLQQLQNAAMLAAAAAQNSAGGGPGTGAGKEGSGADFESIQSLLAREMGMANLQQAASLASGGLDQGQIQLLGPVNETSRLFQCCVCCTFSCDSLEDLHRHLSLDRSQPNESDVSLIAGSYLCNLCQYKTHLKANFQLHTKTDKHLQKLQLVNHIREGGLNNEWRSRYLSANNPVQLRCNACYEFTNSFHKLQVHATSLRHDCYARAFASIQDLELPDDKHYFLCVLCSYASQKKTNLITHLNSSRHSESFTKLMQALQTPDGNVITEEADQWIQLREMADDDEPIDICAEDDEAGEDLRQETNQSDSENEDRQDADDDSALISSSSSSLRKFLSSHSASQFQSRLKHLPKSRPNRFTRREQSEEICDDPETFEEEAENEENSAELLDDSEASKMHEEGILLRQHYGNHALYSNPVGRNGSSQNGGSMKGYHCGAGMDEDEDFIDVMDDDAIHCCSECSFTCATSASLKEHRSIEHSRNGSPHGNLMVASEPASLTCPLCPVTGQTRSSIEAHLIEVHKVSTETVQRLMQSLPASPTATATQMSALPHATESRDESSNQSTPAGDTSDGGSSTAFDNRHSAAIDGSLQTNFPCSLCSVPFASVDELYTHQSESGHLEIKATPRGPGYLCWQKGCNQYFKTAQSVQMHFREIHAKRQQTAISDRHAYKFRCGQCSLAFKTEEKLKQHTRYHLMRAATQCAICHRSFRSLENLKRHVETTHVKLNGNNGHYKQTRIIDQQLNGGAGSSSEEENAHLHGDSEEIFEGVQGEPGHPNGTCLDLSSVNSLDVYLNSAVMAEGNFLDPARKFKCHRCKVAFTKQTYLTAHNKTVQHRRGEKLNFSLEKYLDPGRPYKCDVCKESFTQKNIMLVHFNSVAHIHKVNQQSRDLGSSNGSHPTELLESLGAKNGGLRQSSPSKTPSLNAALASSPIGGLKLPTINSDQISPLGRLGNQAAKYSMPTMASSKASLAAGMGVAASSNSAKNSQLKPFKCNICKLSYTQSTNLDIHLRSVAHQCRAAKLPDLVASREVDPNLPLIEKYGADAAQSTKKLLGSVISQKQGGQPIAGASGKKPTNQDESRDLAAGAYAAQFGPAAALMTMANMAPFLAASGQIPPQFLMSLAAAAATGQQFPPQFANFAALSPGQPSSFGQAIPQPQPQHTCALCKQSFESSQMLDSHLRNGCVAGQEPTLKRPRTTTPSQAGENEPNNQAIKTESAAVPADDDWFAYAAALESGTTRGRIPRGRMFWKLLEDYGFEVVMQFNENSPRAASRTASTPAAGSDSSTAPQAEVKQEPASDIEAAANQDENDDEPGQKRLKIDEGVADVSVEDASSKEEENKENVQVPVAAEETEDRPVMEVTTRCICHHCRKEFSSVWVLKAHIEQAHREMISTEFLDKLSEGFRRIYEHHHVVNQPIGEKELSLGQSASAKPRVTPSPSANQNQPNIKSEPITPLDEKPLPGTSAKDFKPSFQQSPSSQQQQQQMLQAAQFQSMMAGLNPLQFPGAFMGLSPFGPYGFPGAASALMQFMSPTAGLDSLASVASSATPSHVTSSAPAAGSNASAKTVSAAQQQSTIAMTTASVTTATTMSTAASQAAANLAASAASKRARTRITDDQLKILREHFDLNNSPTEEQIEIMSSKSGLPPKVIKHWFRNTLFKERQRNKDCPYNFNNPPTLGIDLAEYEKTGEAKVISFDPDADPAFKSAQYLAAASKKANETQGTDLSWTQRVKQEPVESGLPVSPSKPAPKFDPDNHAAKEIKQETSRPDSHSCSLATSTPNSNCYTPSPPPQAAAISGSATSAAAIGSYHLGGGGAAPGNLADFRQQPNSFSAAAALAAHAETLRRLASMQSQQQQSMAEFHMTHIPPTISTSPNLAHHDSGISNSATSINSLMAGAISPGSSSLTSPGRRANRTRFSDDQLRMLQDFFESNAYPKDDDLDVLSKQLGLSPRVIVVWFQNARQKARKVYENQPAEGDDRYLRTPGQNYQCKKCNLVFQRYYELIKHQKSDCYREEEAKLAAALKLMQGSSGGSDGASSFDAYSPESEYGSGESGFACERCNISFDDIVQLSDHLKIHDSNPMLFLDRNLDSESPPPAGGKHPLEDDYFEYGEGSGSKRQRTPISAEQLELLYAKFASEPNPSAKSMDQISADTGLSKRVVQVWFQNARGRERRGQFGHQATFSKRCPYCGLLFHSKHSMECHVKERHHEQSNRSQMDIDMLPDAEDVPTITSSMTSDSDHVMTNADIAHSILSMGLGAGNNRLHAFQPYHHGNGVTTAIRDQGNAGERPGFRPVIPRRGSILNSYWPPGPTNGITPTRGEGLTPRDKPREVVDWLLFRATAHASPSSSGSSGVSFRSQLGSSPLDLSRSLKMSLPQHKSTEGSLDLNSSLFRQRQTPSSGQSHDEDYVYSPDDDDEANSDNETAGDDSRSNFSYGSTSPSMTSPQGSHVGKPGNSKRFRTHLNSGQIKIMKHLFDNYKTPTMSECDLLGSYIGLHKRVVQVWFQNARAKERKARSSSSLHVDADIVRPTPSGCDICGITYSPKYSVQDHIFSKPHVDKLKAALNSCPDETSGFADSNSSKAGSAVLEQLQATITARSGQSGDSLARSKVASGNRLSSNQSNSSIRSSAAPTNQKPASFVTGLPSSQSGKSAAAKLQSMAATGGRESTGANGVSMIANGSRQNDGGAALAAAQNMLPFMFANGGAQSGALNPAAYYASLAQQLMYSGALGGLPSASGLFYNPNVHGTPVHMLQIPASVMQLINVRLQNAKQTSVKFTQDGLTVEQLKSGLPAKDAMYLRGTEVEVGWACRSCKTVFPSNLLFAEHQRLICHSKEAAFRLIQSHYECICCQEKFGTQAEFQAHSNSPNHRLKTGSSGRL